MAHTAQRDGNAQSGLPAPQARVGVLSAFARTVLKSPIWLYRWTLKPFVGHNCRHLPTCSEYALEAIDMNGAWRGGWQLLARLSRCRPWGSSGYDPVADLADTQSRWRPWRYGDWTGPAEAEKNPDETPERN